jgi:2-dehydro-3-deoxyphosphogalactonate aldolase
VRFDDAFNEAPLIAILRGLTPGDAVAVADALFQAGIRIVEVPMNSPAPLESIRLIADNFSGKLVTGAGTVLGADWVEEVRAADGAIVVAPNTNLEIIRRSLACGLVPMPGFATPTEAFAAYDAGARYLKLFPAVTYGTEFLKQLLAVLPGDAAIIPVGGIGSFDIASWWMAGARGFGIGSQIYRPGQSAEITHTHGMALVSALNRVRNPGISTL